MIKSLTIKGKIDSFDEAIPIGNGLIGALIYKENPLRISVDRCDVWDIREPEWRTRDDFNIDHQIELIKANDYAELRRSFNASHLCYPTKLNIDKINLYFDGDMKIVENSVNIRNGFAEFKYEDGTEVNAFISLCHDVGFIKSSKPYELKFDKLDYSPKIDEEDYMYADYLYNLDVVAKACDKANVEMWTFIQAKNYCDNVHDIDYGALSYQIYVSLAFGSKAILYYTYWTWPGYYANEVDTADETGRVAIISSKGKKTEKYYYAKDIHNEINAFSDIITDCKHLRTYMYAKNKAEIQFKDIEIADDSQFTGSAPIIVGEFLTPNGKKAYLVVNATNPYDGIVNTVRCDIKDVRVYNENRVDCKYLLL